jgi:hypothetical protein
VGGGGGGAEDEALADGAGRDFATLVIECSREL